MKRQLEQGVVLEDFTTAPAEVTVVPATDNKVIQMTITEGKYHQIKRMLLAVDNEVLALTRIAMGPLRLPENMAAGDYRALTDEERAQLAQISQ